MSGDVKARPVGVVLPGRNGEVALTPRELQTLRYILLGKTAVAIAALLSLSPRTVENYFSTIKRKFGCVSKVDLVEHALAMDFYARLGLFDS